MSETFQLGDWEVNTSLNSLTRQTTSVHLEPKMMDVLAYLSAHAGQVISIEQLLIEFWQGTFYGDAPVQKCIAMLRKKLGDNSRQPHYIETVQRRGYRIIAKVVHLDGRQRWSNLQPLANWSEGSPYLGLQTFQPHHAAIFFGRNKAIAEVVHHINQAIDDHFPFLLLMGKSGSGKSSLLRAGVIPFLTRSEGLAGLKVDQYAVITPTKGQASSIFRQLIGALDDMDMLVESWDLDAQAVDLSQHPDHLKGLLKEYIAIAKHQGATNSVSQIQQPQKLIVIDQFEQILQDTTLSKEDVACLISFLKELVKTRRLILVLSLRNDFYANSMELTGFPALKDEGQQYDLQPPNATDIARMIRLPALSAGLTFEENKQTGEKLDEVLLEAAIGHPDALPLMEFTLDLLYQRRDEDNSLLFSAFADMGGLEGAIARQAETTFQSLSDDAKASWNSVFHELVTVNTQNQTGLISRKVPLQQFANANDLAFIQQFVDARLFVTESDVAKNERGSNIRVSVAHEALLKHWQRITEWAADNRVALLKRTQLSTDCNRWLAEGKPHDMLLPAGKKMEDARWIAGQGHLHLSETERQFITLSEQQQQKGQRVKTIAVVSLILLTLTTTGLAIHGSNQTQLAIKQTHQATLLRDKAESLVDYMLGDLRSQLEPIGKLDVLEGVGQKTLDYYSGIESGGSLRQANSLKLLAEININRGQFEQAQQQLSKALALLDTQALSHNSNQQVLFLKGNIHYWIGVIAYVNQNYQAAIGDWLRYLTYSQQLLAQDKQNLKWMLEVSSAQHNIGSLALRISEYQRANTSFRSSIALKRKILQSQPDLAEVQTSLRGSLLGLVAVAFQTFAFQEAEHIAQEAHGLATKLRLENPEDFNIAYQALASANLLIQVQMATGNKTSAKKTIDAGLLLARHLAEQEPQNEAWMTKVATLMFFYWDYKLLYENVLQPADPALLKLTQDAYTKTKNLPIKQKIYSVKVGYERHINASTFLDIDFPGWHYNIESTPRLLSELNLKCQTQYCASDELQQQIKWEAPSTVSDVNSMLANFYFSLNSFEFTIAKQIQLDLKRQGYSHPHLTDVLNRYENTNRIIKEEL